MVVEKDNHVIDHSEAPISGQGDGGFLFWLDYRLLVFLAPIF